MVTEVFERNDFKLWRDIKDTEVEAFLRDLREGERNISFRRSNAYFAACRGFCNWVVGTRKWAKESPLSGMKSLNVKEDPRHPRRAISEEEFQRLLRTTDQGPERFGLSGHQWFLLYWFAVETVLRAGAIRRLRKADVDLDRGVVTVRPRKATENRHRQEQAISPRLCTQLREFLSTKLPNVAVFGGFSGQLTEDTAKMLREDLEAAGLQYWDESGDYFDFHSLRVESASLLIDGGADVKQAQEHLGHSTVDLTLDIYTKVIGRRKKATAAASIADRVAPEQQVLTKTGTDDGAKSLREVYGDITSGCINSDGIGQAILIYSEKVAPSDQNRGPGEISNP